MTLCGVASEHVRKSHPPFQQRGKTNNDFIGDKSISDNKENTTTARIFLSAACSRGGLVVFAGNAVIPQRSVSLLCTQPKQRAVQLNQQFGKQDIHRVLGKIVSERGDGSLCVSLTSKYLRSLAKKMGSSSFIMSSSCCDEKAPFQSWSGGGGG